MQKKRNSITDLKGASRLTKDGLSGIVDIVEAIHYNISSLGGLLGQSKNQRTSGIAGLVYRNVRTVTNFSGDRIELLLEKLATKVRSKEPSPQHEAFISILNGVLGDRLEKKDNPLAIKMHLRQNGEPLKKLNQGPTGHPQKIVLLIHGSCMNDLQWERKGHDHGAELAKDLRYLPFYLLYNSGRHTSENGEVLNDVLEDFMKGFSKETELVILAHSMGGLIVRSAVLNAQKGDSSWLRYLKKIVFIGTPHHGAPLEKIGNMIDNALELNRFSAPISSLGKIRSAGITDLRYGNVAEEDWSKYNRFSGQGDRRIPTPLPENIECFAIAATIGDSSSKIEKELIGDGLVPLPSALGKHKNPQFNLSFPRTNLWIGVNMKHLDLLSHPHVYTIIKNWVQL